MAILALMVGMTSRVAVVPVGIAALVASSTSKSEDDKPTVAVADGSSSLEARRALAKKITVGEFVARTAGPDETVLEFTSTARGCKLENLVPIVKKSGSTMTSVGFTRMRCMDSGDFVDIDPPAVAKPPADAPPTPPPIAGAPVIVEASDLVRDYKADERRADDKYRNRLVEVTGEVSAVGTDAFGLGKLDGAVILKTKIGDVQTNAGSAASSLKNGQKVTLRCTGKGVAAEHETGFALPLLDACEVVKR